MAQNRIIYAAEAVWVGPSPATGAQASGSLIQLHRIQSASWDWSIPKTDVNQFGVHAAIGREQSGPPSVSFDLSYLSTNARNESGMGLHVGGVSGALTDIIKGSQDSKNYWVRIVPEGIDNANYTGADGFVVGIGNGNIASYRAQAAVGGFASVDVSVNALNWKADVTPYNIDTPAVNVVNGLAIAETVTIPASTTGIAGQAIVLKHGDISLEGISTAGLGLNGIAIQSYNLSFDLNLVGQDELGARFPTDRDVQFPIPIQLSVEAQVKAFGTGSLAYFACDDPSYDIVINLKSPACGGSGPVKMRYKVAGAKLDNQPFNSSIGPNGTVTLNFSAQIGGPTSTTQNLFISGSLV